MTIYNLNNFMFTENIIQGFILQNKFLNETNGFVKERPNKERIIKERIIKERPNKERIIKEQIIKERIINEQPSNVSIVNRFFPKSISIKDILKEEPITKNIIIKEEKEHKKENKIKRFVPRKNDTLFWIFYIIMNGFSEYELIGSNDFEIEQTEKYKYIDFLRKEECKQLLKKHKFTKIKEDIENELGHTSRIGHKTFFALCICYKINVVFIYRKRRYQIHSSDNDTVHVIHQYDPPIENPHGRFKYAYEFEPVIEKYKSEEYFNWENIDKPLRCMSYYKVKDLLDICILLKLKEEDYNKLNKQELYEFILGVI